MKNHQENPIEKKIYYLYNTQHKIKKNILLQVHINTHFKDMLRVAKVFKYTDEYNPVIFFTTNYEGLCDHLDILNENKIGYVKFFDIPYVSTNSTKLFKWQGNIQWKRPWQQLRDLKKFFHFNFDMQLKKKSLILIQSATHLLIPDSIKIFTKKIIKKGYKATREFLKQRNAAVQINQFIRSKLHFNIRIHQIKPIKFFMSEYARSHIKYKHNETKSTAPKWQGILNKILRQVKPVLYLIFRKTLNLITFSLLYIALMPMSRLSILLRFKFIRIPTASIVLRGFKHLWTQNSSTLPSLTIIAKTHYEYFPEILDKLQIKLVVIPEHNLFYFTQLAVYLARQKNIPSILVPFTIANTLEWAEAFYNVPERSYNNQSSRIFGRIFPQWVYMHKNRKLVLPYELILVHEMLAIRPKNPWLLNSGNIDFIAVESQAMHEYYAKAGIEGTLFRQTGALYNDELFNIITDKSKNLELLYNRLNITNQLPMMLCALPPNQLSSRCDQIDFESYETIIQEMLDELVKYIGQYNLLINLHPRINPDSVRWLSNYPVIVVNTDIVELIPLASLFIASCSATIRMAITCGVPVVNYDVYQYHYDDYLGIDGVLNVFNRAEYSNTLNQLVNDGDYFNKITTLQRQTSANWGQLDGKNGKRLLHEVDLLLN